MCINSRGGISGGQKWCRADFWSPEIHFDVFLVTRNFRIHMCHLSCCRIIPPRPRKVRVFGHVHVCGGISGGQKFGQWDFWWPEIRLNTFLATRNLVLHIWRPSCPKSLVGPPEKCRPIGSSTCVWNMYGICDGYVGNMK